MHVCVCVCVHMHAKGDSGKDLYPASSPKSNRMPKDQTFFKILSFPTSLYIYICGSRHLFMIMFGRVGGIIYVYLHAHLYEPFFQTSALTSDSSIENSKTQAYKTQQLKEMKSFNPQIRFL